ncbi:MAG: helix-turn-helix transcriptional regulator [Burkholderiaceae bacterium]|nr:helix-turn-helix transcriptional regulator [Microbacteriaceae bacterium]
MTLRSDWSADPCPIARAVDLFGDPWTVLVLREVFVGNRRFDSLRGALGVADTVLSDRLRRLVTVGLLERVPYGSGVHPRHDYRLTTAGTDALPVLHALGGWAERHTVSPSGKRMSVSCTICDQPSDSADWCPTCGTALTVDTARWDRPVSGRVELAAVLTARGGGSAAATSAARADTPARSDTQCTDTP